MNIASLEFVLWCLVLAVGAFGLGYEVLRRLKLPYRRAAALNLGLLLYCALVLALGWLHLLYARALVVFVILMALGTIGQYHRLFGDVWRDLKQMFLRQDKSGKILCLAALGLGLFHGIQSLNPLTLGDPSYQLCRDYLEAHYFLFRPDMWMALLPLGYYGWGILAYALQGFSLTGGMTVLQVLGMCALLAGFARRWLSERVLPYAWIILLAMPLVLSGTRAVREEILDMAIALLVVIFFLEAWWQEDASIRRRAMALVIFLTCFALGGKVTSLALFGAMSLAGLMWVWRQAQRGQALAYAFGCVVVFSSLLIVPWLARAYFYTGNPVWPEAIKIFGGPYWPADAWKIYYKYQVQFKHSMAEFVRLPYFFFKGFKSNRPVGTSTGIWVLALGIPALFLWRRYPANGILGLIFMLFMSCAYVVLVPTDRYFSATYGMLLLLSMFALHRWVVELRWARTWLFFLIMVTSMFEVGISWMRWINPDWPISRTDLVRSIWNRDLEWKIRCTVVPDYAAAEYMRVQHDDGQSVLVLGGRALRYRSPAYTGDPVVQYWIDYRNYDHPLALLQDLRSKGIAYVSVESNFFQREDFFGDFPQSGQVLQAALALTELIYDSGAVRIYRLTSGG